jgi:hypothetical protein
LPGAGHLLLRRCRPGAAILATILPGIPALLASGTGLSSRTPVVGVVGLMVAAVAWMAVIVRTYLLTRPTGLRSGQRALGMGVVTALCLTVAAPLGFAAQLGSF